MLGVRESRVIAMRFIVVGFMFVSGLIFFVLGVYYAGKFNVILNDPFYTGSAFTSSVFINDVFVAILYPLMAIGVMRLVVGYLILMIKSRFWEVGVIINLITLIFSIYVFSWFFISDIAEAFLIDEIILINLVLLVLSLSYLVIRRNSIKMMINREN